MLMELQDTPVNSARIQEMLKELVRQAFVRMIARQESDLTIGNPAPYLSQISAESDRVRAAQKARDWSVALPFAGEIARKNGMDPDDVAAPAVARQVLALIRQLNDLSLSVEQSFDDPLNAGREILLGHGIATTREALKPPMLLSEAIEKACTEAPGDVETKIRVIGKLALAFFGDIPASAIVLEQSFEFLHMAWMLPKGWGKAHGCNRHGQLGIELCALDEIQEADVIDAKLVAEIMGLDTMSIPDKRRRLVQELKPRLTDGYLFVQRDMFNRILRAALGKKRVGRDIDDEDRVVPSHAQLNNRMRAWHKAQKSPCGLPMRVSRPKRRMSWSLEHVSRLLRSPIYFGTSSQTQRSRKATAQKRYIIRDAIYWVPLIMITMGVRPEEILQAAVKDISRRDSILCIYVGNEEDAHLKSEQSRRILPIPQILLDLGFREWVVAKLKAGETWLFPEIQPDQVRGRRLRNLLKTLKLNSDREDIYAMRRTLSSKLMQLGIDTGTRQKILGHLEGTTVDRHYSDGNRPLFNGVHL
ncbi:tyrosine-type recombinase/integrase [Pseudorhodobacter turbinis]|nr:tyrosine-type recombinase/integrase [Pseudorhodobacter turbinis]